MHREGSSPTARQKFADFFARGSSLLDCISDLTTASSSVDLWAWTELFSGRFTQYASTPPS